MHSQTGQSCLSSHLASTTHDAHPARYLYISVLHHSGTNNHPGTSSDGKHLLHHLLQHQISDLWKIIKNNFFNNSRINFKRNNLSHPISSAVVMCIGFVLDFSLFTWYIMLINLIMKWNKEKSNIKLLPLNRTIVLKHATKLVK